MAVTTAAVVGIAAGVASTAKSFSDAAKAKKAQKKASEDAARLMSDARKRAQVDEFAGLSVPTDAYEAAFETTLAANKQQVEALQEGDTRALAAGIGRAGAQAAASAEQTRQQMGQDLFNVQKMKAQSRENIKQQLIGMDVGAAKDAKAEAAYQEQLRAQKIQQGIQGIGQVAGAVGGAAPLFGGGGGAAKTALNPTTGMGGTENFSFTDISQLSLSQPQQGLSLSNPSSSGFNFSSGLTGTNL